jgi:uncharacterized protein
MKKLHLKSVLVVLCFWSFSASIFAQQFKVLLFTKTDGFHHESINEGVAAIKQLAVRNTFSVDWQEDAKLINDKNLEKYQAVIFLNTTGNILNEEQQTAFEKFIRAGKGFVGIHSASDTVRLGLVHQNGGQYFQDSSTTTNGLFES